MLYIFLGLLVLITIIAVIISSLYTNDSSDDETSPSCSSFTNCPEGQVINENATGNTVAECCNLSTGDDSSGDDSSGDDSSGDDSSRGNNIQFPQGFIRCETALSSSQEADDPYNGDCPWPQKQLSEQPQPTTEQPDKGWIQSSLAEPGFGTSGTQELSLIHI